MSTGLGAPGKILLDNINEVRKLCAEGRSYSAIAARFSVSKYAVIPFIKRMKIKKLPAASGHKGIPVNNPNRIKNCAPKAPVLLNSRIEIAKQALRLPPFRCWNVFTRPDGMIQAGHAVYTPEMATEITAPYVGGAKQEKVA